jgi:hypothetical protein
VPNRKADAAINTPEDIDIKSDVKELADIIILL